jgi:hypothetical protein
MRNDRSSSNRIAAWRWRGSQLHDAVILKGLGRVHHRKPFAIVEPFAAQLALAVALIGFHSLTREMQSCRSLFRVRVGKPLAGRRFRSAADRMERRLCIDRRALVWGRHLGGQKTGDS